MKKRNVNWGRVLAVLLTSAMLMQSGIIAWADEPSTISENEAARIAAESEAARIAAESEAARLAAESEAARLAAESEAARLAAESEAARIAAESEAARLAAEQSEAESKAAAESEAQSEAARLAAESEAESKAAAESEAAAKAAAESEAKAKAESEAAAKAAAESEAARLAAEQSEAESKAAAESETAAGTEAAEVDAMLGIEIAPVTYRVTFEKNSEEHGIIRVENQEIKKEDLEKYEKKIASNGEFIFTVQPDKGYDIKSVKIEDKDVPETKNENEYEIEPVIKDVEIKVEYEKLPETDTEAADTEQSEAAEGSAETAPEGDSAQNPEPETEFKFMFQQVTLPLGGEDAWVTGAEGENHSWQVLNENVISIIEQDGALAKIRANAAGEIFLAHTYALDGMNKMETFHVIVTDGTEEEAEPETGETMTEEPESETEESKTEAEAAEPETDETITEAPETAEPETEAPETETPEEAETEIETETESELESESETEIESESELESESETEEEYKTDFYFENEEISITVKALEEAQLPMDTELVAEKLAEDSEAYREAKAAADAQSGADPATSSYLFYNLKLVSNGEKLEPEKGMLTVQVEFKYTSSQNVYNIEDTENGKIAEDVTADAEGNSLSSVDFEV